MSAFEILPISSEIYIPENKVSAWVSKSDENVARDKSKEHQGVWVVDGYTLDKKKSSTEVWIFYDDDELGIDRRVLENNPLQGTWGYAKNIDARKANPQDMYFFPPKSAKCKIPSNKQEYNHKGTWIKPIFKRDFSQLGSNSSGFMTVSGNMKICKGEKHSVAGKWNMLGFNDDVVRGRKKAKKNDDSATKGPWKIFVRGPNNGSQFPISVIPGNKITECKTKILSKKGIPVEDQRLSFNGLLLKDEKTVVGSGIRNNDVIDLGPMIIYVRNRKGKKFTFNVNCDDMVEHVKSLIERDEGTPAKEQRLYFKTRKLTNGKPLIDFNVVHESTLDLGAMIIFIQPHGARPKIKLDVEPTDILKSVKMKVKNRLKMSVSDVRLSFKEKEMLSNSKELQSYRVNHLDTLFMISDETKISKNDSDMIIFIVKEWSDQRFKLRTKPTNTILDVKKMIEASENIPVDQQRLTFKKRSVYNSKTLEQSKIRNRDTLYLGEAKGPKTNRQDDRRQLMTPESDSPLEIQAKNPDSVEVTMPDRSKVQILTLPKMRVENLKDVIEEKTGTPKSKQRLFFFYGDGKELDDTSNIGKAGIKPGSVLQMRLSEDIIEEKNDTPRTFFLDGDRNELPDTSNTGIASIQPGSVLQMRPPDGEENKIAVRLPDARLFFFDFDPASDTMDHIQRKMSKEFGVPIRDLPPLALNGEELDDNFRPSKSDIFDFVPSETEIELPDSNRIVLSTLPIQTIGEIKDIVEDKTGLKRSDQRIFFFDNAKGEIGDDMLLSRAKIQPGTPLKIFSGNERKEPQEIDIKDPSGRIFRVIIDADESGREFKKRIREKIGIPIGGFRLEDKVWDDIDDNVALSDTGLLARNGGFLEIEPPELEITMPNSKKIKLKILPTMTIRDVKQIIEDESPELLTNDKNLRMFFFDESEELNDDVTLEKIKFDLGKGAEIRSMIVNIQHWDGETFELDVQTDWYIDDIKDQIRQLANISPDQQNITFNGELVREELQLIKQGIVHNSTLILEPMSIYVDTPYRQKPVRFAVKPTDTVAMIKRKAFKKVKKGSCDYCLVFGGKELVDAETLEKHDIQHDDLLTLEEFKIRIMHWSGDIIDLVDGVNRNSKIASFKKRIQKVVGTPIDHQKLFLDGRRLKDKNTFEEEKVKHRSILVLERPDADIEVANAEKKNVEITKVKRFKTKEDEEILPVMPDWKRRIFFFDTEDEFDAHIELIIMHWAGEKFTLNNIVLSLKISEIKKRIYKIKGIKKKDQTIKFDGKVLENNRTLLEQNIGHRSILVLESPEKNAIATPSVERLNGIFTTTPTKLVTNINIAVRHWNGEMFDLCLSPNYYIDDVKDLIHDLKMIPQEHLKISYLGQSTHDDKNLGEHGITDGSILVLEPMQIYFKLPTNKESVSLDVEVNHKIYDVKKRVAKMSGLPFESLCFMFGGVELDNSKTLFDSGVEDQDEIRVEMFEVKIMHWTGEIFCIDDVRPNSTSFSVKDKISERKSIPVEKQILILKNQVLNDVLRLKDQGVRHKSVLILHSAEKKIAAPVKEKVSFTLFNKSIAGNAEKDKLTSSLSIKIQHWNGETFSVNTSPTEYVDDLKERIFSALNIPVNQQRLEFQGQLISESTTIGDQGITDHSTLMLRRMKLFFSIARDEGNLEVDVDPEDSVLQVKTRICRNRKIPAEGHCLLLAGEELSDSKKLSQYKIEDGEVLQLEPFRVKVLDLNGSTFEVDGIHRNSTTKELKGRIDALKSIPSKEQILKVGELLLIDSSRLRDQGIDFASIVVLDVASRSPVKRRRRSKASNKKFIDAMESVEKETFFGDLHDSGDICCSDDIPSLGSTSSSASSSSANVSRSNKKKVLKEKKHKKKDKKLRKAEEMPTKRKKKL